MRAAVLVFPGSNCDRDALDALARFTDSAPVKVWYTETSLPPVDVVVIPGGFSYGDYLRAGAMAARAPAMRAVADAAGKGVAVLGICNGFQILCEAQLLPGALMRNAALTFSARHVQLKIERTDTPFTRSYRSGAVIRVPVAHHDGNYFADDGTLAGLEGEGRVVFRYVDADGEPCRGGSPNGSRNDIAGICNETRNVVGLMPHPERAVDALTGSTDGVPMFAGLAEAAA